MQIGDLVRHVVHTGALGIIVDWNELGEAKVLWNNSWGQQWALRQNIEVLDESR